MAQKLLAIALETGITTGKFVLIRLEDGHWWNTSTLTFEAYNGINIADYGIAATETGSTGEYTASNPNEGIPAVYRFIKAIGVNLAESDLINGLYYEGETGPGLIGSPTVSEIATAWGASIIGNGRTRDMYLQGYVNKLVQSEDGLTATLYSFDDTTVLQSLDRFNLPTTVGGVRSLTPTE